MNTQNPKKSNCDSLEMRRTLQIFFATKKLENRQIHGYYEIPHANIYFFIFFYLSKYGDTIWMVYTLRFLFFIGYHVINVETIRIF